MDFFSPTKLHECFVLNSSRYTKDKRSAFESIEKKIEDVQMESIGNKREEKGETDIQMSIIEKLRKMRAENNDSPATRERAF